MEHGNGGKLPWKGVECIRRLRLPRVCGAEGRGNWGVNQKNGKEGLSLSLFPLALQRKTLAGMYSLQQITMVRFF